jgi:acetolactate synthase-1/2/3 large subunit
MIDSCERPYIYFGGGIITGKASEALIALAEKIDAPMGCSLMGLSAVPADHPKFLGMQGMHGHYASSMAEDEADLVIALGARFSDRATGNKQRFAQNFKIIHIDIDGAELHKNIPADLAVKGDILDAVERLTAMVEQRNNPEWQARIAELREEEKRRTEAALGHTADKSCENCSVPCAKPGVPASQKLTPYDIIDIVSSRAPEDTVIATDVGQHQMWTAQRYPLKKPRTFLTSGGLGTMGFGMGAAIGAAVATGRQTVLFTGDGSFGMNLNELATAVTNGLPLVVVIMNNGVLGMVRQWQSLFFNKHYSNTTLSRKTDFVKLAEAFGAQGIRCSTAEELRAACTKAFSDGGTFVIDCAVDCNEFVLPMLPPGGSIDNIITEIK